MFLGEVVAEEEEEGEPAIEEQEHLVGIVVSQKGLDVGPQFVEVVLLVPDQLK